MAFSNNSFIPTPALGRNGLKHIQSITQQGLGSYSNARFGQKWIETCGKSGRVSIDEWIPTPALGRNGLKLPILTSDASDAVNSNARFGQKWIETLSQLGSYPIPS